MRQLGYYKEQSLSSHRPYTRKEIYVQAVILTFFHCFLLVGFICANRKIGSPHNASIDIG